MTILQRVLISSTLCLSHYSGLCLIVLVRIHQKDNEYVTYQTSSSLLVDSATVSAACARICKKIANETDELKCIYTEMYIQCG